jgi:hypothetical protein
MLYHCSDPASRESIKTVGLRPMGHDLLFVWPTLEAAHAYRVGLNASGWADIWSFPDDGESRESPGGTVRAGVVARVLDSGVLPEQLELVYKAT